MSMMFIEEQTELEYTINTKVSKEDKNSIIKSVTDPVNGKQYLKYLVDQYYQSQSYRLKLENQTRALFQGFDKSADEEHPSFIKKELMNAMHQELLNKKYMDIATNAIPVCIWMKSIMGIGPCISAYLYATFDIKVGKYNTNFLSYAGLNDNNNPWLGTEKAKKLTNEAINYRQIKFDDISKVLESKCKTVTIFNKLNSELKKIGKKQEFTLEEIEKIIKEFTGYELSNEEIDISIIVDYVRSLAIPKACDDILINYISFKTKRSFINIKNGVLNNWSKKTAKTKIPTTDDLTSYLAKPPYNKELKTMMYNIGDMFIRQSNKEKSLYGSIYKQKKLEYTRKNEEGYYAEQAKQILKEKNFKDDTITYNALKEGKLSKAHIHARARRYAVKLFISHVFEAMYYDEFHEEPPKTYVIQYMGHHDYIAPETDYRKYIHTS